MTNIFKTVFIFLAFSTIISCGQNEPIKQQASNANLQIENKKDCVIKQPILVDTFSTFPPEIDGCSCYFSNNEKEFKNNIYVYVDDYQDTSFVRINGIMTKFKLVDSKQISEKHLIKKYDNKDFELIIDIKQVGQLDETWQQKGTFKLTRKGGKTITKNIYGECGC
jgi:hypothetical protein